MFEQPLGLGATCVVTLLIKEGEMLQVATRPSERKLAAPCSKDILSACLSVIIVLL